MTRASKGSSPLCNFRFDRAVCTQRGEHLCELRAKRLKKFLAEATVHTKGRFARQPFILARWQWQDIIKPLFGQTAWDKALEQYVRQYRIAWIEVARKNGKSELLAAIALYLLLADDEASAEIYGAAKDTKQARKVWDVAYNMLRLSPPLNKMWKAGVIVVNRMEKKIIYEPTGSYYEIVTADAEGELGHNPHGVVFDEVLAQPNDKLWNALRTGMGAREQPLMVAATTAGNNPTGFAATQNLQMQRIIDKPSIAPHVFAYIRNTPRDANPWLEKNWKFANPALGDFLSIQALRDEAKEAREEPAKENSFRQYRLNQWVSQATRWMPLHLWDGCMGIVDEAKLVGKRCFGGLDLSATTDLTALCWFFPGDLHELIWRFWLPEDAVTMLDQYTAGKASVWVREGFLQVSEGSVVDYEQVYRQIEEDATRFAVQDIGIDRWNSTATLAKLEQARLSAVLVGQGYAGLSAAMKELMRLVKSQALNHGGNPVARWNADSVEVKQDDAENIKPMKPERQRSGARIDAIVSALMALDGWLRRGQLERNSVYESRGVELL